MQFTLHFAPSAQSLRQLPPLQSWAQVAPGAQSTRQLPPVHDREQREPASQMYSQFPPEQLSLQVWFAAQRSLQLPAGHPVPLPAPTLTLDVPCAFVAGGGALALPWALPRARALALLCMPASPAARTVQPMAIRAALLSTA